MARQKMEEKLRAIKVRAVYGNRIVEEMYYPDLPSDGEDAELEKPTSSPESKKKDPNRRPNKCPHCTKTFKFPYEVRRHLESHREKEGRYGLTCQRCRLVFPWNERKLYEAHLKTHPEIEKEEHERHENIKKPVVVNEYLDSSDESSDEEVCVIKVPSNVRETPKPKSLPPLTPISYKGDLYKKHIEQHVAKLAASSSTKSKNSQTEVIHLGPSGRFVCPTCLQEFKFRQYLFNHMVVHNGEKTFECDICHLAFKTPRSLAVHYKIHKNDKKIFKETKSNNKLDGKCPYCEKVLSSERLKKAHILNDHRGFPITIKNFPVACKICKEMCDNRIDLIEHVKQHPDILPFECAHCWQRFRDKFSLKVHIIDTHRSSISTDCGVDLRAETTCPGQTPLPTAGPGTIICHGCIYCLAHDGLGLKAGLKSSIMWKEEWIAIDEFARVVFPGVACNDKLRICPTIEARKWFAH
uniref:C2H2-type domain-containing protein n=1 Tax=Lutzomyia longipalpis TaxID=7200 RepID=A0A1B0CX42_LUTLO